MEKIVKYVCIAITLISIFALGTIESIKKAEIEHAKNFEITSVKTYDEGAEILVEIDGQIHSYWVDKAE